MKLIFQRNGITRAKIEKSIDRSFIRSALRVLSTASGYYVCVCRVNCVSGIAFRCYAYNSAL